MNKHLIIDGSSILFRAFYAIPLMNTKDNKYTNAVLGFMNILLKAIELIEPTNVAVCFDLKEKTFRKDLFDNYKANRSKSPDELLEQFTYIKEVLQAFGIKYFELAGYEADDLAGTLSKDASESGASVFLLSGDKDYLQLIDPNTVFLYTKTGISDIKKYTLEVLKEEMDLVPEQIVDLKGLMGDKSDNIPGIPGVGEKTALKLLYQFGSVENLYAHKDELPKNKTNQKIMDNEELARLSKSLAKIDRDVPIELSQIDTSIGPQADNLYKVLSDYELNSIINRLGLNGTEEEKEIIEVKTSKILSIEEIKELLKPVEKFSFKILSTDKTYNQGIPIKIAFGINDEIYISDINKRSLLELKDVFESFEKIKYGYEIKDDMMILNDLGISLNNYKNDISISQYILDPTGTDYSVEIIATQYGINLDKDFPDKKLIKKPVTEWEENNINSYLTNTINVIESVTLLQLSKIEEEKMSYLYNKIELPLIEVLANMEYTGVYVNKDELLNIGKELEFELDILVSEIYRYAGEEFNINSPKQLGDILFNKLELPPIKKTKTGYSTNIEVLERLEDKHEIISHIIRYRTISKLKSTYVDGLISYINPLDGRIHSNFKQNVAATGRLSSTDPNLQNIPVNTEEGRALRKIFRARDEYYKLIDADYSQIELRLLADISNDENMINSFKDKVDIHSTTASKVFDVEIDEVNSLMRSRAKAVNFGIVYGVSDFGLSQNLKISRKEAKDYIDNYLKEFSGVATYMENIVELAYKSKYVETKFGRKRYLPELDSRNKNIRDFGERVALNMPIQGTAADIIKIAMINVSKKLKENNLKSKLILQIHDELIIEAPIEEVDLVKNILRTEMENAVNLSVPLTVDLEVGDSWYDTK